MRHFCHRIGGVLAVAIAALASVCVTPVQAQVCPFDDGNSSLAVEGLILTRYALGITGAPLVVGTDFLTTDAPTIEGTINCPSCGLNITGNATMTVADATIISRKLAGFSGAALTDGLNLGSGTRNTPAAVNSFLLAGCGATGGTVTSVGTGAGLTGGPITTTGTINLATTQRLPTVACATDQIVKWSGTAWVCTSAASLVPALMQLRPQSLGRNNVDVANTGLHSSTTIGVDGLPIIAYYDQGNQDLKVAHCEDIQCSAATLVTLDSTGDVGKFPSIAIARSGFAVISYYDQTNGALKIAFCADVACSAASVATVDTNNNVGQYSSITIAGNGNLAISYYDATSLDLKLAVCSSSACTVSSTFTFFTVDTTGDVGKWTSIAFGNTNTTAFSERIVIAYFDNTNKAVKLAFCAGTNCASPTFATVESLGTDSADGISMQLGQNNAPILSYYKRSSATAALARIAVCDSPLCATPALRSGGGSSFAEQLSSITLGNDGLPIAAFGAAVSATCDSNTGGTQMRVIRCFDATCAAMSSASIGLSGIFAQSPSMTIGVDGVPFMAGQVCASAGSRLGTLHCSDANCALGYRRR